MKRLLGLALLTITTMGGSAFAQTSSDPITVSGTVVVALTATTLDNVMTLPTLHRGVTSPMSCTVAGTDCSSVEFSGDASSRVTVTSDMSLLTKVGTGGSTGIPPVTLPQCQPSLSWSFGASQGGSLSCSGGTCSGLSLSADDFGGSPIDGDGKLYIFGGATCTPSSIQKHGLYQGTFVVTCFYLD